MVIQSFVTTDAKLPNIQWPLLWFQIHLLGESKCTQRLVTVPKWPLIQSVVSKINRTCLCQRLFLSTIRFGLSFNIGRNLHLYENPFFCSTTLLPNFSRTLNGFWLNFVFILSRSVCLTRTLSRGLTQFSCTFTLLLAYCFQFSWRYSWYSWSWWSFDLIFLPYHSSAGLTPCGCIRWCAVHQRVVVQVRFPVTFFCLSNSNVFQDWQILSLHFYICLRIQWCAGSMKDTIFSQVTFKSLTNNIASIVCL